MKFIFNTNILVSYLFWNDPTISKAVESAISAGVVLRSEETLGELSRVVLQLKFDKYVSVGNRLDFLADFAKVTEHVDVQKEVKVCRDSKDDMFLSLGVNARADFIITGDDDLLVLNPFEGISIIRPHEFVEAVV